MPETSTGRGLSQPCCTNAVAEKGPAGSGGGGGGRGGEMGIPIDLHCDPMLLQPRE